MGAGASAESYISQFGMDSIVCMPAATHWESTWACDRSLLSTTPISYLSTQPISIGDTTITLGGMSAEKLLEHTIRL